jgi:hypothetical protein
MYPLRRLLVLALLLTGGFATRAHAELKTWDGKHSIDEIEVTVVYFVPRDRTPLPDWKARAAYFCRRIEQFHAREFSGQSKLTTVLQPEPLHSARTTEQLRAGDGDFIFFQTLREADRALAFGKGERKAFPILLVLSDINWRPLDDFWRVKPTEAKKLEFEGIFREGRHFPGAASGGARATYLADRGVGWGLVSADGWRVPYTGSDCVVYHEGVGHTVGLPHPEPGNHSVMSRGQYHGWLNESWVDDQQKQRLGWKRPEKPAARDDLFSSFVALPEPLVPKPREMAAIRCTLPPGAKLKTLRVRFQTDLWGPWLEAQVDQADPSRVLIGSFDRPTPVSYRVDATLEDGQVAELWGYFQVRTEVDAVPLPPVASTMEVSVSQPTSKPNLIDLKREVNLLEMVDLKADRVAGDWTREGAVLLSPKSFGARIELPYEPPEEYVLTAVVEPLDEPNGLLLGQRSGNNRFVVLLSYAGGRGEPAGALENVDGANVSNNETSFRRALFAKGRPSQIVCTVRTEGVTVLCDGQEVISWEGKPERLSLSDYWKTPHDNALLLGAYDCRYRFSRVTLTPIRGEGKKLR